MREIALKLLPELQSQAGAKRWAAEPSSAERAAHETLRAAFADRAAIANAPGYFDDVQNALAYLSDFALAFPSRRLFTRDDAEHNVGVRDELFAFMREHGSRASGTRSGKTLAAGTISSTLSTLVTYLGRLADRPSLLGKDSGDGDFGQARKQARQEDGTPGQRRSDAPIRAQHMRVAFAGGSPTSSSGPLIERSSAEGIVRHAAVLFAHNVCARGAELGHAKLRSPLDRDRDLTIASFDWVSGRNSDPPMLIVWLHPAKDTKMTRSRYPMVIQRRSSFADCPKDSDALCAYDALARAWAVLADSVERSAWAATMFFRMVDSTQRDASSWRPVVSDDVAAWCKEIALAAGIETSGIGAKSLRMGCATDMYDLFGPAGAQWLDERGRWDSDIGQIYAAPSAAAHGDISRRIGDAAGTDLQSMLRGWRQPAGRNRH